jgi:Tol biopolymer transport system component
MGTTEMVSVLTGGSSSPTGVSDNASISGNGRYVLFSGGSWSSNPTNRLLVRDLPAQTTAFVDRTWQGNTAGAAPQNPVISDNGRYVVFMSLQGDVVAGDSNATWDVFVRDVQLGTVERVSVDSGELEGNGSSQTPAAISDDGRYVAFTSFATNLDAHDSNAQADVFVRDRVLGTTELASAGANGLSTGGTSNSGAAQPLHMSADGRFVAFISTGDFVNGGAVFSSGAFLRDRLHGTTEAIDVTSSGTQVRSVGALDLTDDGRYVAFDTNSAVPLAAGFTDWNVFLRDRNAAGPWAYGVGQSNSLGCASTVSSSGTPSASAGSGFAIDCSNVLNGRPGLLFYSTRGPNAAPFLGGFLYCKAPTLRTALQNSGGSTSGDDCTGHFSYDFNTRIASGVDANLTAGSDVWAQYWSRDPASPSATNLSSAITFTIGA